MSLNWQGFFQVVGASWIGYVLGRCSFLIAHTARRVMKGSRA